MAESVLADSPPLKRKESELKKKRDSLSPPLYVVFLASFHLIFVSAFLLKICHCALSRLSGVSSAAVDDVIFCPDFHC